MCPQNLVSQNQNINPTSIAPRKLPREATDFALDYVSAYLEHHGGRYKLLDIGYLLFACDPQPFLDVCRTARNVRTMQASMEIYKLVQNMNRVYQEGIELWMRDQKTLYKRMQKGLSGFKSRIAKRVKRKVRAALRTIRRK
jgi:hypothetical protein